MNPNNRLMITSLFAVLLLMSYRSLGVDRLEGRILDDKTGQPIAATLALADGEGKRLEIEGKHSHVEYLGKRRCYVDGAFVLNARPPRLVIELRRGLETLPLQTEVDLTQRGTEALTFRLRRWTDMRELGYLSGDTHVHFLSQSDSHLQMRAEDLHVLNLLVSDFTRDKEKFTGRRRVRARATARSILPFGGLEIVVNGETAAIKNIPNRNRPGPDGLYALEVEGTFDLDRSSWLAARVAEDPASKSRILPRGLTVFAHTNPIYFLRGGMKVRDLSSVRYLQKYLKGTIHWLNTGARFGSSTEKEEALRLAEQARRLYAGLEK